MFIKHFIVNQYCYDVLIRTGIRQEIIPVRIRTYKIISNMSLILLKILDYSKIKHLRAGDHTILFFFSFFTLLSGTGYRQIIFFWNCEINKLNINVIAICRVILSS
jgi:hypothetical protein